jgi:5-methylcytosine-specific restriction protein A
MPTRAPRPCNKAGCRALSAPGSGYCDQHKAEAIARRAALDELRPSSSARGYGRRWAKARLMFLAANPLCIDCLARGRTEAATEVDHEIPHRGDAVLFWDQTNWRARCKPCHSRKTATIDSGFARHKAQRAKGDDPGGAGSEDTP